MTIFIKLEPRFTFESRISQERLRYWNSSQEKLVAQNVSNQNLFLLWSTKISNRSRDTSVIPVIKSITPFWIIRSSFEAFKLTIMEKTKHQICKLDFKLQISIQIYFYDSIVFNIWELLYNSCYKSLGMTPSWIWKSCFEPFKQILLSML